MTNALDPVMSMQSVDQIRAAFPALECDNRLLKSLEREVASHSLTTVSLPRVCRANAAISSESVDTITDSKIPLSTAGAMV